MPARDIYHRAVKAALIADGWTITHDPYRVEFGGKDVYIDLGAERDAADPMLAAERGTTRIAVEIKTFTGPSVIADLEQAVGQYLLYRSWMSRTQSQSASSTSRSTQRLRWACSTRSLVVSLPMISRFAWSSSIPRSKGL